MRIVFIQKSTGRGGAKNSLLESLTAIQSDASLEARVLVGEQGAFVKRCQTLGIPVNLVPLPEWRKFLERLRFSGATKAAASEIHNADWIISNEMWWGPHAARIARHLGCRSAVILRDGIATIPKARQYRLFENDLILPVSSSIAEALAPDPELAARTHVFFNSVRLPEARESQAHQLDERLASYPEVGRWMVVLGRVCHRKKQADAVEVLRGLVDSGHQDLGLILAGDIDADYKEALEGAIHSSGMRNRVVCLGNFDDIRSLLTRAHAVLLTSTREGLPRSLVEAILAGVPAFSYPCEGVEDIFGTRLATFVSSEATPESLRQVIAGAWASAGIDTPFAEVREAALDRFSPNAHLQRLKSLLHGPDIPPTQPRRAFSS